MSRSEIDTHPAAAFRGVGKCEALSAFHFESPSDASVCQALGAGDR
jgi:hypothetical protein